MFTTFARTAAILVVALALLATPEAVQAQEPQAAPAAQEEPLFRTGVVYAGPRVWLGNLNGAIAFGLQAERGFTQAEEYGPGIITGGAGIDFYSWSFAYPGLGEYRYSVVPIQVFSNYHFPIPSLPKVDPYLGLALVYSIVNASWSGLGTPGVSTAASSLAFAGQGGARYFVNERLAIQGQIGFGYGTLGLGATWRF